ncbi:MAG: hypothetical protein AAF667_13765 [Pseudomonadota bacterium]
MDAHTVILLLGGFVLLIEAWNRYDAADGLNDILKMERSELSGVRMRALTSHREYMRGKILYVAGFGLIYYLCIKFPEILEILYPPSADAAAEGGARHEIGSLVNESNGQTAGNVDDTNAVLFAASILAGVSAPLLRPVESALRSVAYLFAGIPRGIHRTIRELEDFNYDELTDPGILPLQQSYLDFINKHEIPGVMDGTVSGTGESLRVIDLLRGPVTGPQRHAYFTVFEGSAPLEKIDRLDRDLFRLTERLEKLNPDRDELEEFYSEAVCVAGELQGLFALFAIRNIKLPVGREKTVTAQIVKSITRTHRGQTSHDVVAGLIFGLSFGALAVISLAIWAGFKSEGFEVIRWLPMPEFSEEGQLFVENTVRPFSMMLLWPTVMGILALSLLAIYARRVKQDVGKWRYSADLAIPFQDYVSAALIPLIFAISVHGSVMIVVEILKPLSSEAGNSPAPNVLREAITDLDPVNFLIGKLWELPRLIILMLLFVFGLYRIADVHNDLPWYRTLFSAVIISAYMVFAAILVTFISGIGAEGRDFLNNRSLSAFMLALPFCCVLIAFSVAAELGETVGKTKAKRPPDDEDTPGAQSPQPDVP